MKENFKGIKLIFIIYYLLYVLFLLIISFLDKPFVFDNIFIYLCFDVCFPLIFLLILFLIFSPVIIALYFLFKKIKNSKIRIFMTAFLVPFLNLIYLLIENCFGDGWFSCTIGFSMLLVFLPQIIIIILCIPKKNLPLKYKMSFTAFLMIVFGLIFIIFYAIGNNFVNNHIDIQKLQKSDYILTELENYKMKNGAYPQKIDNIIKEKNFKGYEYKTSNNGQSFILELKVENSISYSKSFKYCSDKKDVYCKVGRYYESYQTQYGKWIKSVFDD